MTRFELYQCEKNLLVELRAEMLAAEEEFALTMGKLKVRYEDAMAKAQSTYNLTVNKPWGGN